MTASDEKPADEKPRKKRRSSADAGLLDQLFELLENAPRRRGRWRAVRGLARELEVGEEAVSEALSGDDRFEESRKRPGQWRIFVQRDETQDARPADRDEKPKPAKKAKKAARTEETPAEPPKAVATPKRDTTTLTVNVGAEHGLDEKELRNEIVLCAGLDFEDVGEIRVDDTSSKVDVATEYWEDVVAAVSGQSLFGQVLEFKRPRRRKKR